MADLNTVIKSIMHCMDKDCFNCAYEGCVFDHGGCREDLLYDAFELLTEKAEEEGEDEEVHEQ